MNHAIISALCQTLMHSLWQGALLSILTGLVMTLTRKGSASLRYNLLVSALAAYLIVVICTFISVFNAPVNGPLAQNVVANVVAQSGIHSGSTSLISTPLLGTISTYLNEYANWIVGIWLLMVCLRCLQLLGGLREVRALRRKDIYGLDHHWAEKINSLRAQLGVTRIVGLVASARTQTPMVIGHLKPLILIPLGMLASLSAAEAEAILLHELAHIRRADYLVNILQSLMEIVFFFNPAILWLSALIKAERENCCDDMVLARSSKADYLNALVASEEYKQSHTYAMALKGNNGGLKSRVGRIIGGKNAALNSREKSWLALCLLSACLLTLAFTNAEKVQLLIQKTHTVQTIRTFTTANNTAIQSLQILAPKKQVAQKPLADTLHEATKQPDPDTSKPHVAKVAAVSPAATPALFTKIFPRPAVSPVAAIAQPAIPAKAAKTAASFDNKERTRQIIADMISDGIIRDATDISFKIGTEEFVVNYKKQPDAVWKKYKAKYIDDRHSGPGSWNWYDNFDAGKYYQKTAVVYDKIAAGYRGQAAEQKTYADRLKALTSDLRRDGIISSADGLSFTISNREFIVNHQKQPENIYQRYRAKYVPELKNPDWEWEHS